MASNKVHDSLEHVSGDTYKVKQGHELYVTAKMISRACPISYILANVHSKLPEGTEVNCIDETCTTIRTRFQEPYDYDQYGGCVTSLCLDWNPNVRLYWRDVAGREKTYSKENTLYTVNVNSSQ